VLTGCEVLARPGFDPKSQWRASHLAILICDGCHLFRQFSGTNAQRFHVYPAIGGSVIANVSTAGYQEELMKNQATTTL
jgi:hypothetical protein